MATRGARPPGFGAFPPGRACGRGIAEGDAPAPGLGAEPEVLGVSDWEALKPGLGTGLTAGFGAAGFAEAGLGAAGFAAAGFGAAGFAEAGLGAAGFGAAGLADVDVAFAASGVVFADP
ncbi:hypothetical protein CULCOIPH003_03970 [Corynebacterium ulcerans]|uniref:Uncharacterized protein n=1 Tax=Corynebacterium ulcerans TaxID=65058 RepID=A0ABD0BIG0_CORUL|nr:hypothetical protein CULCOIPH001_09450 [Corynebacterium ulcerans]GJJ37766.1 hypothetical protein CULCOIPH003_03970 [Corynebacterium ulcerans]GJJ43712.1 hypothetical protein CULCOIPH005_19010 [Corynebacterium ulcerans]